MATLIRIPENPILKPNPEHEWEHDGAFNGCVAFANGTYHMVYRALSSVKENNGIHMQVSSIGYAKSDDGVHFKDHQLLIAPVEDWEKYGCEDPRITYLDGKFYIFYTALSVYPFAAYGIKLGVAVTSDFKNFEKHPVTTFNSKAMALLPDKIDGKMAALLTINTDLPPAKIALALFDNEEDIWSPHYWDQWYNDANSHVIHLLRSMNDQIELGAPPIKTEFGWVIIYAYVKNYMSGDKKFGIEGALLDLSNPRRVLGRTNLPILTPEEKYEIVGNVPNIVFPSGAVVRDGKILVYYGAADTSTAVASCHFDSLLDQLKPIGSIVSSNFGKFARFEGNPIISPLVDLDWQKNGTFNPAAIYEDGKIHIVYRAQGEDGTSTMGYATSKDGLHIDENLDYPIYTPRESFEKKVKENEKGNSGCEDPRITKINDRLYMTYTAYDGVNPPRTALTSILLADFLKRNWVWEKPKLISPPGVDDKDACVVKRVKGDGYVAFHRLGDVIWLDFLRDLDFPEKKYLTGGIIAQARKDKWDNVKIGIAAPPIETEQGWVLLYHAVSDPGFVYKVGAMLLDYADPRHILARTDEPLLEPEKPYEIQGHVPNVVFPCGAVVVDNIVYLYYGGADTVTCVATMPLKTIIDVLLSNRA
jgi:beta-1,2-mannobiose phosphorylase / 1,2-beta-oligomannan phosphorylase